MLPQGEKKTALAFYLLCQPVHFIPSYRFFSAFTYFYSKNQCVLSILNGPKPLYKPVASRGACDGLNVCVHHQNPYVET